VLSATPLHQFGILCHHIWLMILTPCFYRLLNVVSKLTFIISLSYSSHVTVFRACDLFLVSWNTAHYQLFNNNNNNNLCWLSSSSLLFGRPGRLYHSETSQYNNAVVCTGDSFAANIEASKVLFLWVLYPRSVVQFLQWSLHLLLLVTCTQEHYACLPAVSTTMMTDRQTDRQTEYIQPRHAMQCCAAISTSQHITQVFSVIFTIPQLFHTINDPWVKATCCRCQHVIWTRSIVRL